MPKAKYNIVYITAKNKGEARKIGKALVESKLAACCNIFDNINSIYNWEGKTRDDKEAVIIAKTKERLTPKLIKKVKSMHSYSCPCIVSFPISSGNKDFLSWIDKETI